MIEIHNIGDFTTAQNRVLSIYMVEHQGGVEGLLGEKQPPGVCYGLDENGRTELLFWPDWLAFAHSVNGIARQCILDPMVDPAEELGIAVPIEMACPDCNCRIMDVLVAIDDLDLISCQWCGAAYDPLDPNN